MRLFTKMAKDLSFKKLLNIVHQSLLSGLGTGGTPVSMPWTGE